MLICKFVGIILDKSINIYLQLNILFLLTLMSINDKICVTYQTLVYPLKTIVQNKNIKVEYP